MCGLSAEDSFEMGRLQIRIIFALYALGALVSVAAGSIEFGLAGRIVNPSGIVSSLVALFLAITCRKVRTGLGSCLE